MAEKEENAGKELKDEKSEAEKQQLTIQRIYLKDLSFEAPRAPELFKKTWEPKMQLDMQTESKKLEDDVFEVLLRLTVTTTSEEETAFLVEVKQAGIFAIQGLNDQRLHHCLNCFCPNILYPYAREAVSDIVTRGSFPQCILAPVNFDALYAKHLQEQAATEKSEENKET
ncbi:MAG: protein-export chaperone SecB [Gammaproteobacteria bacterium]